MSLWISRRGGVFGVWLVVLATAMDAWSSAPAADWPQWLGPDRASEWRESGVIATIPATGLPTVWRAPVGLGYSGPAVSQGKVFVADYVAREGKPTNNPGGRDKLQGRERLLCFDAATGDKLWEYGYDRSYEISYASGPRCTPTVDGDHVYFLGAEGNLSCLNAQSGKPVWSKDFRQEYGAATPMWGHAAHPLVAGDLLYCLVGGQGSLAVAFNKLTGREVWRALSASDQGYCPPTIIEHGGARQLLIWHPQAINGLDPASGKVYWSVPLEPSYQMSVTMPRKSGSYLFASGIGSVGAVLKLDDQRPAAEIAWRGEAKTAVYCCNSTPFLADGLIFGNDCQTGSLMGVRLSDGQRLWETHQPTSGGDRRASHGTAYIVRHDDRYFLFSETGDLILARLTEKGYEEQGRFHVLDATNECFGRAVVWSHPAFANRSLYARNDQEIVCVSLAAGAAR